jgi:Uma2 family endonuclease
MQEVYYYPDVVGVCGEPQFEDETFETLLNPTLIVEVLSETTESNDRGQKRGCYQTIPSLTTYVLISQHRAQVEIYRRQENGWLYTATQGREAVVTLEAIGVTLRLADLYARVTFPPPAPEENADDTRAHRS